MNKKEISFNEKYLINNIIKINNHLLKGYIINEEDLKKQLRFFCKNYLNKTEGVLK